MPLIMNIEDARFVEARFSRELNILDRRTEFIREMARVILTHNNGYESVWTIANRVYDRHCLPESLPECLPEKDWRNRDHSDRPARTALSA
jgi:hypothetical protein